MKLIIDINEKDYNSIISDKLISPRNLNIYERMIANGTPLSEELEKLKTEIKELKSDSDYYEWYGIRRTVNLINKHLSELKGE